jgi:hypothetical protein
MGYGESDRERANRLRDVLEQIDATALRGGGGSTKGNPILYNIHQLVRNALAEERQ